MRSVRLSLGSAGLAILSSYLFCWHKKDKNLNHGAAAFRLAAVRREGLKGSELPEFFLLRSKRKGGCSSGG